MYDVEYVCITKVRRVENVTYTIPRAGIGRLEYSSLQVVLTLLARYISVWLGFPWLLFGIIHFRVGDTRYFAYRFLQSCCIGSWLVGDSDYSR